MKFCKTAMAFLTLFSVYNTQLAGSAFSDIRRTIRYICAHPLQSTGRCLKITIKGLVIIGSCYTAAKCIKYRDVAWDGLGLKEKSVKRPFETPLIGGALALLTYICADSLIDDIKELK